MLRILLFLVYFSVYIDAQYIIPADPYIIIKYEQKNFIQQNIHFLQTTLRPLIYETKNNWHLKIRNELYYNSGSPNLENMDDRIVGKGFGSFNVVNISYLGRYIKFSIEPFYYINQNLNLEQPDREGSFTYLNDHRYKNASPYKKSGLRNTQIFLNYEEFTFGLSKANIWWGPGLHTSLTMTNNTIGFPYLMIGTLREKKYRSIGYNFRYIFTQLNKTKNNPYYNAFSFRITFYTKPIFTIGFNSNILFSKFAVNGNTSKFELATLLFRNSSLADHKYQTFASYFIIDFPKLALKVFFEIGSTDKWRDFTDFLNYPDHGIGSIFGFRQYNLFNNQNLIMGFEYARLTQSSYWEKRPTPNWYDNMMFDYSTYDGRRWAAHSGSDSDDLYIYFGFQSEEWSFIPSFNYERHGIVYIRPAEVKMEFRLDLRYKLDDYYLNIFFEREWLEHAGFMPNKWRIDNVIWFGIERDITNTFFNKLGLVKN